MKINNIGYDFVHSGSLCISREHGADHLLVLFKSNAEVETGNGKYSVEAGSYIIYKPGMKQLCRSDGKHFACDWAHFSVDDEEYRRLTERGLMFNEPVKVGGIAVLSEILRQASVEFFSGDASSAEVSAEYLKILLLKLVANKSEPETEDKLQSLRSKLKIVRGVIFASPTTDRNIDKLAESADMSRSKLGHAYKEHYGVSVMTDIINSRVEFVKLVLKTTELRIGELGDICGYSSTTHFVRQFKLTTGLTPSEYRIKYGNTD